MAIALTIAGAKAGDRLKLAAESLGNGTFSPVLSPAEDYIIDRSSR